MCASPATAAAESLIALRGVAKSFAGVAALRPLDLEVRPGEILGLVGENGAGKSTLIKLLSGVHAPDAGEIAWRGATMRFAAPSEALAAGIATIHQELEYFGPLSVAENMLLGEPWPRKAWGGVDWKALHATARKRLEAFGLHLATERPFDDLTAAEKQEIAIATALSRDAKLLILDEPTASLTEPEVARLFGHLRRLRAQGVAMIYVSHRLDEIFALTDRIAVLRDGQLVAVHDTPAVEVGRLIRDMVGRPLDQVYPRTRSGALGSTLLEVTHLSRPGMFQDINLSVRAGEIVGLAGLVGAGRSEVARTIYGLYPASTGTIRLAGEVWKPKSPRHALRSDLAYLPEERKRQGLVLTHSVHDSIAIGFSDRLARLGIVRGRNERARVGAAMQRFDVRASNADQAVGTLSGGNQQKALLARWLERDPRVMILDEPTRGVDVGAKSQIHAAIDQLAAQGKAVLLISSDLPELVGMCDRVLVMNRGTIGAELAGPALTEHNVVLAASGLPPEVAA